jgi:hypothetical protein
MRWVLPLAPLADPASPLPLTLIGERKVELLPALPILSKWTIVEYRNGYHHTAGPRAATLMNSLPLISGAAGLNGDFRRSRSAFSIIFHNKTSKSVDTIRGYTTLQQLVAACSSQEPTSPCPILEALTTPGSEGGGTQQ